MNAYDSYQTIPGILDRMAGVSSPTQQFTQVPVIRVYGSLPSGHNILCHIHGIFPYIFVSYDGQDNDSVDEIHERSSHLHSVLERAVRNAYGFTDNNSEVPDDETSGNHYNSKNPEGVHCDHNLNYIANVSVVKALPFYGYHCKWEAYYKVSLLNPAYVTRVADMLREGKILGQKVETFESHIPYLLQFCTDYNLFGCSWLKTSECYFRTPLFGRNNSYDLSVRTPELDGFIERFNNNNSRSLGNDITRMGNSMLEIDVLPQFIRNRDNIEFRNIHTRLIEEENTVYSNQNLFIPSTKELWNQIEVLRNQFSLGPYVHPSEEDRCHDSQSWHNQEELLAFLEKAKQRTSFKDKEAFDTEELFTISNPLLKNVCTTKEAVEELWPSEFNAQSYIDNTMSEKYKSFISSCDSGERGDYILQLSDSEIDDSQPTADNQGHETSDLAQKRSFPSNNDLSMTQTMATRRKTKRTTFSQQTSLSKRRKKINSLFRGIETSHTSYQYKEFCFGYESILPDLEYEGIPAVDYMDPHFGDSLDLKRKDYVYSGQRFNLKSLQLPHRAPVEFRGQQVTLQCSTISCNHPCSWKYAVNPPAFDHVSSTSIKKKDLRSQIDFKTPSNEFGYKYKSNSSLTGMKSDGHNRLSHISLEIHVDTRGILLPDPKKDPVTLIFWEIEPETFGIDIGIAKEGILSFSGKGNDAVRHQLNEATGEIPVALYDTELEMFEGLVELIQILDPDLISGFEIHSSSWGYIIERCKFVYDCDFCDEISRVRSKPTDKRKDRWGYMHASGIQIPGRHALNIWRLLRSDLNLLKYTVENITFQVLHERLPHLSHASLTKLWNSNTDITSKITVINYWRKRVSLNLALLQKREIISQTVEQARLLGIDFYSVFSRGSQYKVESILVRLCKSEYYILSSPSKTQVRKQKALECIPLVMEPESSFYKSPLIVLDFQSLYPSIMIAYNYCYSTLLGRVQELKLNNNRVGTTKLNIPGNLLKLLEDDVTVSPNGAVFVKQRVRKSMLAKMLTDILDTRFMVKTTMNAIKDKNETISRILNNKQLALKLLANVTYGYTSASFSGRMPCSDVADSIVQTGRETLEKAIAIIEENTYWGAKVVYGDTDSLFVYLPGKSRENAFKIGREMATEITKSNPSPVTLKFEKVYHPCILVSKKRYVGYSFDHERQRASNFDAKGIETVRRDGHPAQQKIVEKALRILFDSQDLSAVKRYVQEQFRKITRGEVSIQDFCFAREVKLGSYKSDKTAPPSAVVATKKKANDHRAEPQYRERVSYVVVKGYPGQILRERCIPPEEFLCNEKYELDSNYYIRKTLLPPLQRFFNLLGVDISEWYYSMPKVRELLNYQSKDGGLPVFMRSVTCIHCRREIKGNLHATLCENCCRNKRDTVSDLLQEQLKKQTNLGKCLTVCRVCCEPYTRNLLDRMDKVVDQCDSQDCPVYYSRVKYKSALVNYRSQVVAKSLEELEF